MKKEKYFGFSNVLVEWKYNTKFENWLSYKADRSELFKKLYVLYYKHRNRSYYEAGLKMIDYWVSLHSELQSIPRQKLISDMVYCVHRFGFTFEDYAVFKLQDKSFKGRSEYVSDKLRHHYEEIVNGRDKISLLNDKYRCYEAYKEFYKREAVVCRSKEDGEKFVLFAKQFNRVIVKPLGGCCGRNVELVTYDKDKTETYFEKIIAKGAFIAEEVIQQAPELAVFHPKSINTVRVLTFLVGGQVHFLSAMFRMGRGDSLVDNAAMDNLFAGIDCNHGIIKAGATEYKSDTIYNFHPDTHVQIVGFQLPEWDKLVELITAMATKVKDVYMVGWDVAYADKGWVMVEANADGAFTALQRCNHIGLKPMLFNLMDRHFDSHSKA